MPKPEPTRQRAHPAVLQQGARVRIRPDTWGAPINAVGVVIGKWRQCRHCDTEQSWKRQKCLKPGKSWCEWGPWWIRLEIEGPDLKGRYSIQARNCEPVKEA